MSHKRASRWKLIVTVVTLVALVILVYAIRGQIADVVTNLGRVNTWFLLLMIPLQILNYHSYARMYQNLLGILGRKVPYRSMVKVSLELNFVNNVFPSGGVSGISYFSLRMRNYNVLTTQATLVQFMKFGLVFVSFQILLFFGLIALAVAGKASNLTILVAGSLATLLFVGTFIALYVIGSRARIRNFSIVIATVINRTLSFIRRNNRDTIHIDRAQRAFEDLHDNYVIIRKNWRQMGRPMAYALTANIAEILTIYAVYAAFGEFVNIGAVILAYAVANFAGLVSVLPGGVGIYEALMTAVLATAGVRPSLSIPVTVMYRVLNMLIQLPPGYYFYHRAVGQVGQYKNDG